MSHQHAVADFQRESYPAYESKVEDGYVAGYNPMSLAAPHSSLLRNSTWIGMGLTLSMLPAVGILLWGLAVGAYPHGTAGDQNYTAWAIIGIVAVIVMAVAAYVMIHYGRRYYRQFEADQKRRREQQVDRATTERTAVSGSNRVHTSQTAGNAQPVDAKDL